MELINLRQLFLYKRKALFAQLCGMKQKPIIKNEVKNYVVVNVSLRDMK